MDNTFNLSQLLKQLGLSGVHELEIVRSIQPTVLVGDGSAIVPPLLPPTAYAGGSIAADATHLAGFQILAAPTGTTVRSLAFSVAAVCDILYRVVPVANAVVYTAGPTALTNYDVGYEASRSILSTVVALTASWPLSGTVPTVRCAAAQVQFFDDYFFIPAGHVLEIWSNNAAVIYHDIAVCMQDVVAHLSPQG